MRKGEARLPKETGVDQGLLDVIGDDETRGTMYYVDFGVFV